MPEDAKPAKSKLKIFNDCLTVAVIVLSLYVIATPFLPQIGWWVRHDSPISTLVAPSGDTEFDSSQVITDNMLLIPRLDMAEVIHQGGLESLNKGVWRRPSTRAPDQGGNTVLVGHRFTYSGQSVFYHLDKVQKGDAITLHWRGQVYEYEVTDIKVVPATETAIEQDTTDPQLTLYTCTPLWTMQDRLVVIAKPKGVEQ